MKKTTLITLALACSLSLTAFAFPAKDKMGSFDFASNYQFFTNDDLSVQPDHDLANGVFELVDRKCSPVDHNQRFECSGIMHKHDLRPGQETFTIASSVSGDECAIVVKFNNQGRFSYDPTQSKCTGPNNWYLVDQSFDGFVKIAITQNY